MPRRLAALALAPFLACASAPAPNLTQRPTGTAFAPPAQLPDRRASGADPTGDLPSPLSPPGPAPALAPAPAPLTDAVAIALSRRFGCAARSSGDVVCWGEVPGVGRSLTPVVIDGLARIRGVRAGGAFACAIDQDSGVFCWGSNELGQLGTGARASKVAAPAPVMRDDGKPLVATALSLGEYHACAVSGGAVYCWGDDSRHQVANARARVATKVPGSDGASDVAAGAMHTCATLPGKTKRDPWGIACWGADVPDAFGADRASQDPGHAPMKVAIELKSRPSELSAGYFHTCVIDGAIGGGAVRCWQRANRSAQAASAGRSGDAIVVSESTAAGTQAIAVGGTTCWTLQSDGTVAPLFKGTMAIAKERVAGIDDATAIAAGGDGACALRRGGQVWCWGKNERGQLGDGTTNDARGPVEVAAPARTPSATPSGSR